jgi:hypothetical protein
MKAWGDPVVPRLRALGLDVATCAAQGERLVFEPDGRLSLTVLPDSVEVALELAPRDVAAIQSRLADPERALELTTAVEALPEQFAMGGADDARREPVAGASAANGSGGVRALFERAEREQRAVWIGWTVPRDLAIEHAALLDEQLEDALVVLGALLALVAWAPAAAADAGGRPDRRQRARKEETERHRKMPKRDARARGRDRDREREREVEAESESPGDRETAAARPARHGARDVKMPPRPGLRRRAVPVAGPVEKGGRVRVLEGPFAGKVGVVQELDGKGGARVMLGLLAVRIDVKDLVAWTEGRARPLLSSSHRRVLPVRS